MIFGLKGFAGGAGGGFFFGERGVEVMSVIKAVFLGDWGFDCGWG